MNTLYPSDTLVFPCDQISEGYKLECSANSEFEGSVKSLAAATIRIYRSCRLEMEFCSALLEHELLQNPDPNSLWRGKFFKIFR